MRKMLSFLSLTLLGLSACATDESISKFVDVNAEYYLVSLGGQPFDARATISFPAPGEVVGQAPCNRYFAMQTVPYPWFGLEGVGATRMACPDLDAETAFFTALENMTLAEVSGETLILSNPSGGEMVFEAR